MPTTVAALANYSTIMLLSVDDPSPGLFVWVPWA